MKLVASSPVSSLMADETSKRVLFTLKLFVTVLVGVCNRKRVSVYDDAGL